MVAPSRMVRAVSVSLFALGAVVMDGPETAQALDCKIAPPKQAKERWVYKTVDGKRCWLAGSRVSPDTKLSWTSAELQTLKRARDAQAAAPAVAAPDIAPVVQREAIPLSASERLDDPPNSFEARWRRLGL
jgi:photosystem II stability/assembly factor-like uncharacterized protein